MEDRVKKFFAVNTGVDVVYSTSDGFLFTKKQDATVHSFTLENKEISEFERNKIEFKEVLNYVENEFKDTLNNKEKQVNNKKNKKNGRTTKGNVQNTK